MSTQEMIARNLFASSVPAGILPKHFDSDDPVHRHWRRKAETQAKNLLSSDLVKVYSADVWDEGYSDCWDFHISNGYNGQEYNPYRPLPGGI